MAETNSILVTGGAGFIGSNLVRHLLATQPATRVVTLDALRYPGDRANLAGLAENGRHTFIQGDVRDQATVTAALRDYEVNFVAHLAADTHVDRSIATPEDFVQVNVLGTLRLLEAVREVAAERPAQIQRLVHVSTDEVFGSLAEGAAPFGPDTSYRPRSPYAASKAGSDHLARAWFETYGLPIVVTNCSNNYGPYQHPEKLIPLVIANALAGERLPLYGDGEQVRDWLYVEDHCRGLAAALASGQSGATYLFGGGAELTNRGLIEKVCAVLDELRPRPQGAGYAELIQPVADRPGHDRRYALDTHTSTARLGWRPMEALPDGLRKTVAWYLGDGAAWLQNACQRPEYRAWLAHNYEGRGEQR